MRKFVFLLVIFLLTSSCEKKVELRVAQGNAFGSTYTIQYYAKEDLNNDIKDILQFFDDKISTYRNDTDLAKFNASLKGEKVDSIVLDLWKESFKYYKKTKGYFDPTVQPLSNLYGFKKLKIHNKPTQKQVDSVLEFIGMDKTFIKGDSILKKDYRTELVFNAITGCMNDYIANFLNKKGIKSYLVEIGGEIIAKGQKDGGKDWVVGVDVPKGGEQDLFTALTLKNEALATSGNYRKYYLLDNGEKIVHTMNPINGETGVSNLLSATVIAPLTAEADATATALMAMGLGKAEEFANAHKELKILLIWADSGKYKSKSFNGFNELKVD